MNCALLFHHFFDCFWFCSRNIKCYILWRLSFGKEVKIRAFFLFSGDILNRNSRRNGNVWCFIKNRNKFPRNFFVLLHILKMGRVCPNLNFGSDAFEKIFSFFSFHNRCAFFGHNGNCQLLFLRVARAVFRICRSFSCARFSRNLHLFFRSRTTGGKQFNIKSRRRCRALPFWNDSHQGGARH